MSIDCCKSYVGKQIIGLLPGGAEECWYLVYLDSNYFGYSNWTGWTLNGNDLVTELTAICQAQGGNVAIRDGITNGSVLWGFYLGTSDTTYAAYDPANNETPIPFNVVVQCEACYQFEVPYGENIKGINVANIIEFLSITRVDDEAGLQTELELLFGPQVSVSSVWNGSNYIVTINNAWDPGSGISLVNSSGGEYIGSLGVCPITPPEPVPLALLDAYTGAAAAYSVRKLSSSYTGAALRVRRSSDNTEQDIGFVGLDLDTTALSSFVGAGNGFVTKWYDQSGNSADFSQATASLQMKIVNAGTIETSGGKPAIRSLKNTGNRMDNNLSTLQNLPLSIYTCFELVDLSNNQFTNVSFIYNGTYSILDGRYRLGITNSNYITQRLTTITQNNDSFSAKRNIFANLFRSTQIDTYQNLNSYIGTAYSGAIFNSPSTFRIGANFALPDYFAAGGYYQEFIIYLSDQNTNNTGIRTNINSYFSVY